MVRTGQLLVLLPVNQLWFTTNNNAWGGNVVQTKQCPTPRCLKSLAP
jgi:hypothetical protein